MHAQELEVGFYAKFKEWRKFSNNKIYRVKKIKILEKLSYNLNENLLVSGHYVNENCIMSLGEQFLWRWNKGGKENKNNRSKNVNQCFNY